jgi:hypothetical protein
MNHLSELYREVEIISKDESARQVWHTPYVNDPSPILILNNLFLELSCSR